MDRWTIKDLENVDDLVFAITILNERRNKLNAFSPLAQKLKKAVFTITALIEEKEATKNG